METTAMYCTYKMKYEKVEPYSCTLIFSSSFEAFLLTWGSQTIYNATYSGPDSAVRRTTHGEKYNSASIKSVVIFSDMRELSLKGLYRTPKYHVSGTLLLHFDPTMHCSSRKFTTSL